MDNSSFNKQCLAGTLEQSGIVTWETQYGYMIQIKYVPDKKNYIATIEPRYSSQQFETYDKYDYESSFDFINRLEERAYLMRIDPYT
jgi:hypothetical protein